MPKVEGFESKVKSFELKFEDERLDYKALTVNISSRVGTAS